MRFLIGLHTLLIVFMAFCFANVIVWRTPDELTGFLAAMYPLVALNSLIAIFRISAELRVDREWRTWHERMANIDQEAEQLLANVEERKQRRDQEAGR